MKHQKIPYRHNFSKYFFFNNRIKVGILGGSFNPSHQGHIHISHIALKQLKLKEIWWLVSPQNRLKDLNIRSTFKKRMEYARQMTLNHKKIKILDLENKNQLFSTYDSLQFIKKRTRNTK